MLFHKAPGATIRRCEFRHLLGCVGAMRLFLTLIALFFLTSLSRAAAPEWSNADHPCRGDVVRFCNDVSQNKEARIACMKAHWSQLSAACRSARQSPTLWVTSGIKPSCERHCFTLCINARPASSSRTKCYDTCMGRC